MQVTGGVGAALALMPVLEGHAAQAPQSQAPAAQAPAAPYAPVVAENDKRLAASRIEYPAGDTKIAGYLARLKEGGKRPAVLVIHENRGLTPHIEDVARRMAVEGFLALAPDMLSPLGGAAAAEDQATKMIGTLKPEETVARLAAAVKFLASHPESTGKVGVVGFCWGGAMTNRVMASGAGAAAGVPYYGSVLPADQVPQISGPLLLQYAGTMPGSTPASRTSRRRSRRTTSPTRSSSTRAPSTPSTTTATRRATTRRPRTWRGEGPSRSSRST